MLIIADEADLAILETKLESLSLTDGEVHWYLSTLISALRQSREDLRIAEHERAANSEDAAQQNADLESEVENLSCQLEKLAEDKEKELEHLHVEMARLRVREGELLRQVVVVRATLEGEGT